MSAPGPVGGYLQAIWERRYFWLSLAAMDIRGRYRRSVFGLGWSLLHPLAMTAVLCFVFHQIFGQSIGNYALFVLTGMMVWTFLSAIVTEGCLSFYRAEGYIRSQNAPLAIYPLRAALGVGFHLLMTLALAIVMTWTIQGVGPILPLLTLLPSICLLFLFGWAVAILFGLANAFLQDTQHLAQIGLQILFYLTPVLYPPAVLEERGLALIPRLNPLGSFFELFRQPILAGRVPDVSAIGVAAMLTLVTIVAAGTLLARLERRVIFQF